MIPLGGIYGTGLPFFATCYYSSRLGWAGRGTLLRSVYQCYINPGNI